MARILLDRCVPLGLLLVPAVARAAETSEPGSVMAFPLDAAVVQLILFVLVIVVLGRFVWPKIAQGLDARDQKVRSEIETAEAANAEARVTLERYESQLADAKSQAKQIVDQSRAEAQRQAGQLKQQAQDDITQMRQRAEADIESAKEQCIAEIFNQTASMATGLAGRILAREIRPDEHERLVQQSLEQMSRAKN